MAAVVYHVRLSGWDGILPAMCVGLGGMRAGLPSWLALLACVPACHVSRPGWDGIRPAMLEVLGGMRAGLMPAWISIESGDRSAAPAAT